MAPFLIVVADPSNAAAQRRLRSRLNRERTLKAWPWRQRYGPFYLFFSADHPSPIHFISGARGLVIGDVFDQTGARAPKTLFDPERHSKSLNDLASALTLQFWGRYVAVLFDADTSSIGVLRDPSGAVDCMTWTLDDIVLASNDPSENELEDLQPLLSINWEVVRRQLCDPAAVAGQLALNGLNSLTPGALRIFRQNIPHNAQVWRPSLFAKAPDLSRTGATERMVETVDRAVRSLAGLHPKLLAEVSGGLDSSIVAASLQACSAPVRTWINFATEDRAGDERVYASTLAQHLNFTLVSTLTPASAIDPEDVAVNQTGVRPSLVGLDRQYDEDILDASAVSETEAVITGLGGDAVFFQLQYPPIIVDRFSRLGLKGLTGSFVRKHALWTRKSAASLLRLCVGSSGVMQKESTAQAPLWVSHASNGDLHPWLEDLDEGRPAKRLQVQFLIHMLLSYGASRRARRLDLLHPLLTQPVIELCLSLPIDLLVMDGRDRALARLAFSDRLPADIIKRRSKGDHSAFQARGFAAGLPKIRSWLLNGRLVDKGLVNSFQLEASLEEGYLARFGGHLDLLRAVAIEAWLRHWEARINALV